MKKKILTVAMIAAWFGLGYAGGFGWYGWRPAPALPQPAAVQSLGQYQYWSTIRPQTTCPGGHCCPGGRCPLMKPKELPKPPESADDKPSL